MQNDYIENYIEEIELTPTLQSKKCRLIAYAIGILLQTSSFIVALLSWYFYDIYVALATLLVAFIVIGIARSKIRNSVIPISQSERHYNDMEIGKWYSAKELCDDTLEMRLEKI
jgi:hypothetical protein